MDYFLAAMKNYATFSGRARRKEYWFFVLFIIIISVVLGLVEGLIGTGGLLGIVFTLGTLIPSIAVGVRRLHDTDRSGWWLLIALVPVIGAIVLIVFYCLDGTAGANRFGADPKAAAA